MNSRIKPVNHAQLKTLREAYISLFDISLIGLCDETTMLGFSDLSFYEADYVMDACRIIVSRSEGVQDVFVKALLTDIDHVGKELGLKYLERARRFLE